MTSHLLTTKNIPEESYRATLSILCKSLNFSGLCIGLTHILSTGHAVVRMETEKTTIVYSLTRSYVRWFGFDGVTRLSRVMHTPSTLLPEWRQRDKNTQ